FISTWNSDCTIINLSCVYSTDIHILNEKQYFNAFVVAVCSLISILLAILSMLLLLSKFNYYFFCWDVHIEAHPRPWEPHLFLKVWENTFQHVFDVLLLIGSIPGFLTVWTTCFIGCSICYPCFPSRSAFSTLKPSF